MISGLEANERSYLIDNEGTSHVPETEETVENASNSFSQTFNDTLSYINNLQINNSTLNETIHEMASFFKHLLGNVNESFFSLVNILKQKLDNNKQTAKELILNAKKIASEQLKTIQKKLDEA